MRCSRLCHGCSQHILTNSVICHRQTAKQCGTCCLFKILNSCYTPFLEYIKKYATEEALKDQEEMSSSSESSISDFSEDEAQDMEL